MPESQFQSAITLLEQRLDALDRELSHHQRIADRLRITTHLGYAGAVFVAILGFVF